jgi:MFS family permease
MRGSLATQRLDVRVRGARTVLASSLSITLSSLPIFMLGALAVFVRRDLDFRESQLGLAVSVYYLTSAVGAVPGGRLAERLGAATSIRVAAVGSCAVLIGLAVIPQAWSDLILLLVGAGVVNAVAQPAANLALARGIETAGQGMAFGLKQSAIPAATLLSGASVPILGLTVGWRWAFAAAGAAALSNLVIFPRGGPAVVPSAARRDSTDASSKVLLLLSLAASFAVMACSALGIFYVESAVARGFTAAQAGVLLFVGGVSGIGFRILWGWLADRRPGPYLRRVVHLLLLGATGFVLLATSTHVVPLTIATVLAFGAGWGWQGLFHLAVVRQGKAAPAVATGIVSTGLFSGGIFGTAGFGALVEQVSYLGAWLVATGLVLLSAVLIELSRVMLRREIARRPRTAPDEEPAPPVRST